MADLLRKHARPVTELNLRCYDWLDKRQNRFSDLTNVCQINHPKAAPKASDMSTYVFRVVLEPDEDRRIAYSPVLTDKGGATWGMTKEEALDDIRQVLQMTVQSMAEHGEPIPEDPAVDVQVYEEPQIAVTL